MCVCVCVCVCVWCGISINMSAFKNIFRSVHRSEMIQNHLTENDVCLRSEKMNDSRCTCGLNPILKGQNIYSIPA